MKQKIIIKKVIINSNEEMSHATPAIFVGTETVTLGTRELRLPAEDAIFVKDLFASNETLNTCLCATENRVAQLEKELQDAKNQLGSNINPLNLGGFIYWVPQEVAQYIQFYCPPTQP